MKDALEEIDSMEAFSVRIKFGDIFNNFTETTNIPLNAVVPEDAAPDYGIHSGFVFWF